MDYLNYIFENTFGSFDAEEKSIIDNYLNFENENNYPDSEILEVMICYYLENENIGKAEELLEQALKLYPNDEDMRFLEILIAEEKDVEYALELTENCLKKYSDRMFFLMKTLLLFRLNDFDSGEEAFYDFIEKIGDDTEKIEMYYRTAIFLCSESLFDYDSDDAAAEMKCTLLIKKFVDYAVSQEYSGKAILYFAEDFFSYGFTKEAKLVLNKAIDDNSYNLDAWKMLSEINIAAGEYAEAADAFLYRIALKDSDENIYFNCAICFQKARKYELAIEYFDLQMDKFPEQLEDVKLFCDILAAQGDCFMAMNKFDDAKKKFKEVLKINKNHFKALVLIAQCLYYQEDNENALIYLNNALSIKPDFDNYDYENLYRIAGQIFVDVSSYSKKHREEYLLSALVSYRESLVYLNLARKMEKNYEDDLDTRIAFTLFQIGKVHLLLNNNMDALMNLQLAFHLNESISTLNIFLVIAYTNLKFYTDAYVHYQMISTEELEQYEDIFPELKYYKEQKGN